MCAVSQGSVITAPASHGWVKDEQALHRKEAGKKRGYQKAEPSRSLQPLRWQTRPTTWHPTPTPTRGVQARTSVPSLAASLHRRHRTCKGQHPGQPPWKQPGSEWVSEAHIQTCFITKQNRGQQKPENSDPENTYISKHALQSIPACEEKQVTETTVILCRSHGHGLAM